MDQTGLPLCNWSPRIEFLPQELHQQRTELDCGLPFLAAIRHLGLVLGDRHLAAVGPGPWRSLGGLCLAPMWPTEGHCGRGDLTPQHSEPLIDSSFG